MIQDSVITTCAMGTSQEPYNDNFNPFADENDDLPDFSGSRVVLSDDQCFDMTEFPIYDEGLLTARDDEQRVAETAIVDLENDSPRLSAEQPSATEITPVLAQPMRIDAPNRRRLIPVYTVGWASTSDPQFIPATGLDFLTGVPEVNLHQTVTNLDSPNKSAKRYILKIPNGETLYYTSENSRNLDRVCCGSQRSFTMSVLDHTQQEAATLVRTSGCVFGWLPCLLQEIKIYVPGEHCIGRVKQDFAFRDISFTVLDSSGQDLYRIFGPNDWAWSVALDATFTIAGGRGGGRLGIISRRWDNNSGDYKLSLTFPASGTQVEHKMLLISAAFLIEYMFFEHRSASCIRLC